MPSLACVITTIQEPTDCVRGLVRSLAPHGATTIVIGDRKGPARFDLAGCQFHDFASQPSLPLALAKIVPAAHYARKNIGYLLAIQQGAACIYETDDDNAPLPHWAPRAERVDAVPVAARPWFNVYRLFTDELIWPRGFPLDLILSADTYRHDPATPATAVRAPIQQGLANGAPDVDAVWRLVLDHPVDFIPGRPSVWLPPGTYCPFNSQTTWWWPAAYPLLYLPSHCSFRMTDIWRSFVAQRCLWEIGCGLVFHAAEAFQLRNPHNLLRDFKDEVPGYLENDRIRRVLEGCTLRAGEDHVGENLRACYTALVAERLIPSDEMPLVDAWLADLAG
jgi:hypothetical protein